MATLHDIALSLPLDTLRMRVDTLNAPSRELWDESFEIYREMGEEAEQAARLAYSRVMRWWETPSYQAIVRRAA